MPLASLRPCLRCRKLNQGKSYCEEHKPMDRRVGSYAQRSKVSRAAWDAARTAFLRENPCCVMCKYSEGKIARATVVDHIVPHRGSLELFWDQANWQPLCARHHSVKTAKEDGGFGNR